MICLLCRISFDDNNSDDETNSVIELVVEIYFLTDIVLNFLASYYSVEDDVIITDFKLIAKKYFK